MRARRSSLAAELAPEEQAVSSGEPEVQACG